MNPNKSETAVHGRLCPGDIAMCIHEVLAKTWVGVPVSSLPLKFVLKAKELERLIYHMMIPCEARAEEPCV